MTFPFYRNAFIYINLHPAQNKARIQNLPSERDWKLGSLFRPEIKTNTHERLSLSSATSLAEGTEANVLRLCHCRSSTLYSDLHHTSIAGVRLWTCCWGHERWENLNSLTHPQSRGSSLLRPWHHGQLHSQGLQSGCLSLSLYYQSWD